MWNRLSSLIGRNASEAALIEWDSDGKARILCVLIRGFGKHGLISIKEIGAEQD